MYGALIPKQVINQAIKDSKEYKIYLANATGVATPKKARKFKKIDSPSKKQTLVLEEEPTKKPKQSKHRGPTKKSAPIKKDKASSKDKRSKGIELLSDAALLEEAQLKKALKRSKRDTNTHQASGSSEGSDSESEVTDELKGDDEDVFESDNDHEQADDKRTESDDEEQKTQDDEYVHTPGEYVPTDDETNDESKELELKTVDHSAALLSTIKSKVLNAIKEYLRTSLDDVLYKRDSDSNMHLRKELKTSRKIKIDHARKQQEPKETITLSNTSALEEFDQKTTLFQTMTNSKSFNRSPKQRALYHALMESILVRIKSLLDDVGITTAYVLVNTI
nr:hypothetical protein [Tanacetum cinerariifolium]